MLLSKAPTWAFICLQFFVTWPTLAAEKAGEASSSSSSTCRDNEFQCPPLATGSNSNSKDLVTCIPKTWVCDGDSDCPNGADEDQNCKKDICNKWGICSQRCRKTDEGYKCLCNPGYTLKADRYSCKPDDPDPVYIIFCNRHGIQRLNVHNKTLTPLVSGLRNAIALDFHFKKSLIFWTDVQEDIIYRGEIKSDTVTKIEPLIDFDQANLEGIAVDWIGNNIYWVESNLDQIEVAKLDGSNRKTVIAGNMTNPRAIVLDPRVGKLFWTDWDSEHPRIETCSMAGELHTRDIIYEIPINKEAGWPNGLTVDYEAQRLYWVDARSDSIHSITYTGGDHQIVLQSNPTLRHPFALTVFEHYVYWTDWRVNALGVANKFSGSNAAVIQKTLSQPFDLQVYHPKRQPQMPDPCKDSVCSHLCLTGDGLKPVCLCPEQRGDNITCESTQTAVTTEGRSEAGDNDICNKWGICSQRCRKTDEGYKCLCNPGYTLKADRYSCKPDDPDPVYIIFTNRHQIERLNVHNSTLTTLLPGLRNTIALDFHFKKSLIFWTDVMEDKIYRGEIKTNAVTKIQPIIDFGLATTEGIAVDWIGNNIYWVESSLDQIEVAKLDGSNRKTLIAGNMKNPRAIVLDPRVGKLFWTDWNSEHPRIETCSMAGELHTRDTVYKIRNDNEAGWPNGLTVDYEAQRLYWVDARSDSIHSITYTGGDHRIVLQSHPTLGHPFALTVFEHYVYWTDWKINGLGVANKFNGSNAAVVKKTLTQPFDLQVYHPKRQPQMEDPCKNSACSHLCLTGDGLKPVCLCPQRFKLSMDNITCENDNLFLLFAKANEIQGVDMDSAHYTVIPSIIRPDGDPRSIDYDYTKERLYWTDKTRNVITSAYLNGTEITTVIDSGLSNPSAFAIDWMSGNMYFSSYDDKEASISVARLDGAFRKKIIHLALSKPHSIAVHPSLGWMYWSDLANNTIWKAKMDGSSMSVLVQGDKVKNATSLTLDLDSNHLYWINKVTESICYCDIYNCSPIVERNIHVHAPISMTIYKPGKDKKVFLFYANNTSIVKYQNGKKTVMREDIHHVYDLKIYDPKSREGTNDCSVKNGGCEQLCLPSGNRIVCECTVGYEKGEGGVTCKGILPFLLYSQGLEIHGLTMDTKEEALAPISKISNATWIDFHADNGLIYWVDRNLGLISRSKRDLSEIQTVVSLGISGAESLAVDWIGGNVYWTDQGNGTIEMANLNGSLRYVVLHDGLEKPRSIVVHPAKGYMYFVIGTSSPRIVQTRLDGSDKVDFVTSTTNHPMKIPCGLAIDYTTDDLYWCDQSLGIIERVTPDKERFTVIKDNLTDCISLTVHKDFIYWADRKDLNGSIKYSKKTGGDIHVFKKDISTLKDIKIFDPESQKGTNECGQDNGGCEELCLYKGDHSVTCVCSHGKLDRDGKSCTDYDAFLLYSEVTSLKTLVLDNSTDQNIPHKPIQNETHLKNVIGLAFDYSTERIFFSDIGQGNIQSVFFNGTSFKVIKSGVGSAEGLAFDPTEGQLYWTSYTDSNINRISVTSQNTGDAESKAEVVIQLQDSDHPRGIVLSACRRQIFWTNWSDQRPSIQTAAFNATGVIGAPESIIIRRIQMPNGLTIDHKAQKLYWSDARLDKIERCDLDGTNRVIIITTIPRHSFGLALYDNFLYWTDWMHRAVLRANKYDGSEVLWLTKDIYRHPMGILAVAKDTDDCTTNPCHNNAYGCSDFCKVDETGLARCECSEGKKLLPDRKRCAPDSLDKCGALDFVCEDFRLCIPYENTCNGVPDCLDASDESEDYCNTRKCPLTHFKCLNSSRCIPDSSVCDDRNDCEDGSDELNCPCGDEEFRCTNGLCILDKNRCDYISDCPDHSDEIDCNKTCEDVEISGVRHHGFVSCNTTSVCIDPNWICDGVNDCLDNNDEASCESDEPGVCAENAFVCDNGNCILLEWRCDKHADCADGSDEVNCTYTCEPDQHACNDSTCIPQGWVCDGHPDCPDGSDEPSNCTLQSCDENYFKCLSGRCIHEEFVCDGEADCAQGEDERVDDKANCSPVECAADQFLCLNNRCIKNELYCNGEDDCLDNSDEPDDCEHTEYTVEEFQCKMDLKCIKASKRCNQQIDCQDSTDERDCPTIPDEESNPSRSTSQFQCDNKVLIDESLVCNSYDNCGDGSDESSYCGINECTFKRPVCSQICVDKKIGYKCQCYDGYQLEAESLTNKEESPNRKCVDVNECTTFSPCSHRCTNTIGSFKCSCAPGYNLLDDGHSCVVADDKLNATQFDSCATSNGGCEFKCTHTESGPQCSCKEYHILSPDGFICSFDNPCDHFDTCTQSCHFDFDDLKAICSCEEGYQLVVERNYSRCLADGEEPKMLIANNGNLILKAKINRVSTEKSVGLAPKEEDSKINHIIAIDMDYAAGKIFFINQTGTDFFLMKMSDKSWSKTSRRRRVTINNQAEILQFQDRQLFEMGGLAVDWISQHIYLTDVTNHAIYVYNYDGRRSKEVVKGQLEQPHSIVVDPVAGYIFWSDGGPRPKIERANLDGSNRFTIALNEISWPNGLALDAVRGWVYWADVKKHTIEVAKYDGTNRQTVYSSSPYFQTDPPYALDLFEDYIYVLTYNQSRVLKLHKFGNHPMEEQPQVMYENLNYSRDIVIVQESKQPKVQSNCTTNSCGKTQLCFNKPQADQGFVCYCPDGSMFRAGKCDIDPPANCTGFCLNGGTCDISQATGKPKCRCLPPHTGLRCEKNNCDDYCSNGQCIPPAKQGDPLTCNCTKGFSGERCDSYVCTNFCQNSGICHLAQDGTPKCLCPAYYEGDRCEKSRDKKDWCPQVCQNGAECVMEKSTYITCKCKEGFIGKRCDQCTDMTCHNGGSCFRVNDVAQCKCLGYYDPAFQCNKPKDCQSLCLSKATLLPDKCDCNCTSTNLARDCNGCEGYCQHGTCTMENGKPKCH